ncbi:MAG: SUMF1/EgtB/PvdO family nonheme iron enzyme [Candidatus Schekmanbacteria bacterium]|nr:SUMF1/EgtB/PvdO family nonheme iron enzyme [Candidatus Schekmanbacteria bacterium]
MGRRRGVGGDLEGLAGVARAFSPGAGSTAVRAAAGTALVLLLMLSGALPCGAAETPPVSFTLARSTPAAIELEWTISEAIGVTSLVLERDAPGEPAVPAVGNGAAGALLLLMAAVVAVAAAAGRRVGLDPPPVRRRRARARARARAFALTCGAVAAIAAGLAGVAGEAAPQGRAVIGLSPADRAYTDAAVTAGTTYSYRLSINGGAFLSASIAFAYRADQEVLVFAGEFTMGCGGAQGPYTCDSDEAPAHAVWLDAFYLDSYEAPAGDYAACERAGACSPTYYEETCNTHRASHENHPINCLWWSQAEAYCRWRGKRLPTEAEWEKAARGTDGRIFPWGDGAPDCATTNINGCVGDTVAIGSYPLGRSAYGAHDMAGNVSEWVADWYDESYYAQSPYENPTGPESGSVRIGRGDTWWASAADVRAAKRSVNGPGSRRYHYLGVRCARDHAEQRASPGGR